MEVIKMEKLLEQFISHQDIYYHFNVVIGHTKVKTNWKATALTMVFHHVVQQSVEYYFFCFERNGIYLYQYENHHFIGNLVFISWNDISSFRYHVGVLEVEISFIFKGEKYHMMLTRKMRGERWAEENINYLLENQFFSQ